MRIEIDAYDVAIRKFLPGYDEMLALAARTVAGMDPGHVLDLGAGARAPCHGPFWRAADSAGSR